MKRRVTITVDSDVLDVGLGLVSSGAEESVSGWVNATLRAEVSRRHGLAALAEAVADYEREFGELTPGELTAQNRADASAAAPVRPAARRPTRSA